jgi:hypothetical protein
MGSPTNLSSLIKAEEEYIEAKEAALEKWSENICANINNARNIKDKWMEFRKFTNKKSNNTILRFFFPTSGFHQHGLLNFLLDFEIFGTAISIQFRKLSSNSWYICSKFYMT